MYMYTVCSKGSYSEHLETIFEVGNNFVKFYRKFNNAIKTLLWF